MPNRVEGRGPLEWPTNYKLAVVGEAPGRYEDEAGIPFVGPSGKLVDEMLTEAGVKREDVYVSNVLKYRPPNNEFWRYKEIQIDGRQLELSTCIKELWGELNVVRPNCILALGNEALRALTGNSGITQWRGSILKATDPVYKVVSSFHPANFLDRTDRDVQAVNYAAKSYVQLDFNRAVQESLTSKLELPRRRLDIARNSLDLYRFFRTYKDHEYCAVDIEVHHCIPVCIGFAFTRHHAISVPLFHEIPGWGNVMGLSKKECLEMWKLCAQFLLDPRYKKIGQNFKFDHQKLLKPLGMDVLNFWVDTMFLAHTLYPELPKGLAFLASIWTREPYYKDDYKEYQPKRDSVDQIFIYNARDAAVTVEVYEEMWGEIKGISQAQSEVGKLLTLDKFFFRIPMPKHRRYMRIENVGLLLNVERNAELLTKYTDWWKRDQSRLDELCKRHVNVASPKQIASLLYTWLELPVRYETDRKTGKQKVKVDEDTIVALLNNHAGKCNNKNATEILDLILTIRRVRKTIGTYILAQVDYDGRMRTVYNPVGTETGRSSTSLQEPPVRPPTLITVGYSKRGKPKKKKKMLGLAFQTMTKHGSIGADLLSQFDADPGHVFVEVDMSQAEARIVALLAEDYELLKLFNTPGYDIHKMTASWVFGMSPKMITKDLRFIGKTTRHAGNYDMKKRRHMLTVNNDAKKFGFDIQISEWRAGKNLEIFHEYSPKIRGVFHEQVRQALLDNDRILVNPFGRRRQFLDRLGEDLYKEAFAQIPQSTVPDQLGLGIEKMEEENPDLRIAVEWHDSILMLVPVNEVEQHVQLARRCIETPIDFSECTLPRGELIIPIEAKVGDNYKRIEDYKINRAA